MQHETRTKSKQGTKTQQKNANPHTSKINTAKDKNIQNAPEIFL